MRFSKVIRNALRDHQSKRRQVERAQAKATVSKLDRWKIAIAARVLVLLTKAKIIPLYKAVNWIEVYALSKARPV